MPSFLRSLGIALYLDGFIDDSPITEGLMGRVKDEKDLNEPVSSKNSSFREESSVQKKN